MYERWARLAHPGILAGNVTTVLVILVMVAGGDRTARPVSAHDAASPTPLPTTLRVSGHGSVSLPPDTAEVIFGVTIEDDTLAEAQSEATAKMAAILAAVTAAGVAEEDVRTTNFSVTILYDYDDSGVISRVIGYQVSNQVSVKVRDLPSLGGLLDAIVAEGANTVQGISFVVEDTAAPARQARSAAVEDAMTKAEEMAAAAGMRIARVLTITEISSPVPSPELYYQEAAADMDRASAPVPIQPGTTELTADVEIIFELEAA
jgi:hypothetical protein